MMMAAEMARRSVQSGEMLPLLERHEIQVLLRAGFGPAEVTRRAGASEYTVQRVRREDAVEKVDDAAAHRARGIGRPSKTAPFADKVAAWLTSGIPARGDGGREEEPPCEAAATALPSEAAVTWR